MVISHLLFMSWLRSAYASNLLSGTLCPSRCFPLALELHCLTNKPRFVHSSNLTSKRGLFVKQRSSKAKGNHLERHGVPDNKLEAYSDLKDTSYTWSKNEQPMDVLPHNLTELLNKISGSCWFLLFLASCVASILKVQNMVWRAELAQTQGVRSHQKPEGQKRVYGCLWRVQHVSGTPCIPSCTPGW